MKNHLLTQALNASLESDAGSVDDQIEELAADQLGESNITDAQAVTEIEVAEGDIDTLNQVEETISGNDVSMEQLAHARGIVDAIGARYGAERAVASMESLAGDSTNKDAILADIANYRTGLESHVVTSMEGFFIGANSLSGIGRNLSTMKKTVTILKSGDIEKIKQINLAKLKLFLRMGGGVPSDIPRAIKEVGAGLELTLKHSSRILDAAQKAAELASKVDWKDPHEAEKCRSQIRSIKLDLDTIVKDINGFPMFGNRSFGIKVKGEAGDLGEWNKKFSFSEGTPNAGLLHSTFVVIGLLGMVFVSIAGGIIVLGITYTAAGKGGKREIPMKDLAGALDVYIRSAEKIYNDRSNAVKKNTVHKKLMNDLKTVKGLPRDVRKAIARASSFGWSMSNGVYDVVAHTAYALADMSVRAAYD